MKRHPRLIRSEPPTYASVGVSELQLCGALANCELNDRLRALSKKPMQHDSADDSDSSVEMEQLAKFVSRHDSEPGVHPNSKAGRSKEDTFSRAKSAISLPVSRVSDISEMSAYEKASYLLQNDESHQRELSLGKRIGLYRLGKELGCGNFSKVKLGVHVLTKGSEKVAVKIMEKSKMDQKAQRLLHREIQSMEKTHHPNIIRLFECVETLPRVHLILEYAGGGELYAYVHEKGKLTEADAKPLFAQIVSAVAHMHHRNLVHRDIKAENIMFSAPGVVKLVDFGFSCMLPSSVEQLHTFCGSPPYAAPELFRDQSYNGSAVDIWALGVLLYFMVIGVTPFRGESVNDLKTMILKGSYTTPEYLTLTVKNLIKNMLEMNPEKRAAINEIKRSYWMQDCRFEKSYYLLPTAEDKVEERDAMREKVWHQMHSLGITQDMYEEAQEKGPRHAVTGTYRIVLYQVQTEAKKKPVTPALPDSLLDQRLRAGNSKQSIEKHKGSKTCTLI